MGLDSVELLYAVEEEFQIEISDAQAEAICTVGDFHDLIIQQFKLQDRSAIDSIKIFEKLRSIIVEQLSVAPEEVTQTARFVQDLKMDN